MSMSQDQPMSPNFLYHSWHLSTAPTQVKQNKTKQNPNHFSLPVHPSLSFSPHHHLLPPSFLDSDTSVRLAQLSKNTLFSLHLVLNLLQIWENKKYSFWVWLTHGLIGKYMWNSWVDLAVNNRFGSNFMFRTKNKRFIFEKFGLKWGLWVQMGKFVSCLKDIWFWMPRIFFLGSMEMKNLIFLLFYLL